MIESWKDIVGYEGLYQVSDLGRIRSMSKRKGINGATFSPERIMSPTNNGKGYMAVSLCKNSCKTRAYLHRITAMHFKENPFNLPEVNHEDGNKSNCASYNLSWTDRKGNEQHAWATGLKTNIGANNKRSKAVNQYSLSGELVREWASFGEIERTLKFIRKHLRDCCNGKAKASYGFVWQYKLV